VKTLKSKRELKQRVKTAKGRKNSSTEWLRRQLNDKYVKKAKQNGYRSRAAFKLIEIDEKFSLLKNCRSVVIDIGAAPGSWLQVINDRSKKAEMILGIDLKEIDSVGNTKTIQGDFTDFVVIEKLLIMLEGRRIDLIVSDMAPDSCGIAEIDHLRIVNLVDNVVEFAKTNLNKGGNLVCKMFNGAQYSYVWKVLCDNFESVKTFKPQSSRSDSAEIYFIALHKKVN
jgi:23S rRNA (uridine2552-2'-O)-methyltransferase